MTNLDIETFWAVVHHGTMTAAAESLYITQPTLSMRIRALEERVGTPLFVRGKGQRHIALTEAGQKFLTLAQRWQQLLAETDSLAELGQREYLRIAATYTTNQYILPPVYKRFLAQGAAGVPVDPYAAGRGQRPAAAAARAGLRLYRQQYRVRRPADGAPGLPGAVSAAVAAGQPHPEEVETSSLNVAEELLVTWDPEFIRWHDRWFGAGARPLLYADTLQAADFLPPTEGRWVAAPTIAAASRIGKRQGVPLYIAAAGSGKLSGDQGGREPLPPHGAVPAGAAGAITAGAGQRAGIFVKKAAKNIAATP